MEKRYSVQIKDDTTKSAPLYITTYSIGAENKEEAEKRALENFARNNFIEPDELNGIIAEAEELPF